MQQLIHNFYAAILILSAIAYHVYIYDDIYDINNFISYLYLTLLDIFLIMNKTYFIMIIYLIIVPFLIDWDSFYTCPEGYVNQGSCCHKHGSNIPYIADPLTHLFFFNILFSCVVSSYCIILIKLYPEPDSEVLIANVFEEPLV